MFSIKLDLISLPAIGYYLYNNLFVFLSKIYIYITT